MENKHQIIKKIIDIEWEMFKNVKNVGGPASCQSDRDGFYIYRKSKFIVWPYSILKMYLRLLIESTNSGRNLCTEKYGYMMKETHPLEFKSIEGLLPKITNNKKELINEIWEIEEHWLKNLQNRYPNFLSFSRPIKKTEIHDAVSIENYSKSELMTYNMDILQEILSWYKSSLIESRSLSEESYILMVSLKGFKSLQEAEDYAIKLKDLY